jgi:hypothetical protein
MGKIKKKKSLNTVSLRKHLELPVVCKGGSFSQKIESANPAQLS